MLQPSTPARFWRSYIGASDSSAEFEWGPTLQKRRIANLPCSWRLDLRNGHR
jgi:hypothetical protein